MNSVKSAVCKALLLSLYESYQFKPYYQIIGENYSLDACLMLFSESEIKAIRHEARKMHCRDDVVGHKSISNLYPAEFQYHNEVFDLDTYMSWFSAEEIEQIDADASLSFSDSSPEHREHCRSVLIESMQKTGVFPGYVTFDDRKDVKIEECLTWFRPEEIDDIKNGSSAPAPRRLPRSTLKEIKLMIDDLESFSESVCFAYGAIIEFDFSKRASDRREHVSMQMIYGDNFAHALSEFKGTDESSGIQDCDYLPDVMHVVFECAF